ncbi:MAG: TatD family hydrolase [Patescibacteria group bacterium]
MYIDTHVQLNFADFDTDRAAVIGNAKKAGVKQFVVPGVDHNSCRTALHLAKLHPSVVYAAVGFHPYEAPKNPDLSYLETLLNNPENKPFIVAIGECGLDYHEYRGEVAAGRKDVQQRLFIEQLNLAVRYDLPVIIHCREAFDDVFGIITSLPKIPRGVFHCFSGSQQDLRIAVSLGFYIGIDGNVTYSKQLPMVVPHIPEDSLVLETDAPYLTPVPHRGKRNEPKYIPLIAEKIALLQNKPVAQIRETTTRNAQALFGLVY